MTSPGRDDLARVLERLVQTSGLLSAEIGRRAGLSKGTTSRHLRVILPPSPTMVRRLVTAMGLAGTPDADAAVQLAEDLHTSRVVILRSGSGTMQRRFGEIERDTAHVEEFVPGIVSGLLQTERYARAVFTSAGQAGAKLEDNVTARLARAELLDDPDHQFTLVMSEGALRWHVVGPDVMVPQLEHIADRARLDTGGRVRIGVIPWPQPVIVFPLTAFDLYDRRAVIVGTDFGTAFPDRAPDVAVYVQQFTALCAVAVFDGAAAVEVDRIADDFRGLM